MNRQPYPTDVSDDEWALVAPYLTLMTPDAPQRTHDLRSGVQRSALVSAHGLALADDAARPAALAGGVPADAPLAERGGL